MSEPDKEVEAREFKFSADVYIETSIHRRFNVKARNAEEARAIVTQHLMDHFDKYGKDQWSIPLSAAVIKEDPSILDIWVEARDTAKTTDEYEVLAHRDWRSKICAFSGLAYNVPTVEV